MKQENYEFIGFLFGEGCFRIGKNTQSQNGKKFLSYRPIITISLRDDDCEILKWAKSEYGGCLIFRKGRPQIPKQNPYCMWMLGSVDGVLRLCNEVLESKLPSIKKEQVRILKEFCETKVSRKLEKKRINRKFFSEEELQKQHQAFEKLKKLKKYNIK